MAVKLLADGNQALYILTTKPASPDGIPTVAELTAGINASCEVAKSGTYLRATGSETINDSALCESGNSVVFGAGNAEGQLAPYLFFDGSGTKKYDPAASETFEAIKTKGTTIWAYIVEAVSKGEEAEAGDLIRGGEWVTDEPQAAAEGDGWIKRTVPLGFQSFVQGVIAGV